MNDAHPSSVDLLYPTATPNVCVGGVRLDPTAHTLYLTNPTPTYPHTYTQRTQHTFPPQPEVLAAMGRIAQREKQRDPSAVFYVGCYSIGKERCVRFWVAVGRRGS